MRGTPSARLGAAPPRSGDPPRTVATAPYNRACGAAVAAAVGGLTAAAVVASVVIGLAMTQSRRVIHEVQSRYQRISVVETGDGRRQLIFDGHHDGSDAVQSEVDLDHPNDLMLAYARHMVTAVPLTASPKRILIVGLGGACLQRFLHARLPEATIETAELDPEVRAVAARFFFLREDARQVVHIGDGRAFVERTGPSYDLILLDAFSATAIPAHLTTREFVQAVRRRVAEGGVVAANLWDGTGTFWDMVRTYAEVFPEIHLVKCAGSGNSILVAMPTKPGLTVDGWADRAAAFDRQFPTGLDLRHLVLRGAYDTVEIPSHARVLTDRKAPAPTTARSADHACPM